MGWGVHKTYRILGILDMNEYDKNHVRNYRRQEKYDIEPHANKYISVHTSQVQNNDQMYNCEKNSLNSSDTAKIISKTNKYYI